MSKLTVDDIEVPKGMINAVINAGAWKMATIQALLENALLWLAENPIVPSDQEAYTLWNLEHATGDKQYTRTAKQAAIEWQRRMFLRKQESLPDEVKKLFCQGSRVYKEVQTHADEVNERITAAYKLGKEGK